MGVSSDKCIRAWGCVIGLNRPGSLVQIRSRVFLILFLLLFFLSMNSGWVYF